MISFRELLFWNADSLSIAKLAQLRRVALSLSPALIAVCESKLPPDSPPPVLLPDYNAFTKPFRSNSGGVVAFVHRSIPCAVIDSAPVADHCLTLKMRLFADSDAIVCVAYRKETEQREGWKALRSCLLHSASLGLPFLWLGDFNGRSAGWGDSVTNSFGRAVDALADQADATILNARFAFGVGTRGSSILDLAISNAPHRFAALTADSRLQLVSDHVPLRLFLAGVHVRGELPPHRARWQLKRADWQLYSQHLARDAQRAADAVAVSVLSRSSDEQIADNLNALVVSFIEHAAVLAVPRSVPRRHVVRAWSPILQSLLEKFRKAKRRLSRHPGDGRLRIAFNVARSAWRRAFAKAQVLTSEATAQRLQSAAGGRLDWATWRRCTGKGRELPVLSIIDASGTLPVSAEQSLNRIASYFADQCVPRASESMEERAHERSVLNKLSKLVRRSEPGPFGAEFSAAEVDTVIALLPTGKAAGPDDVPAELLIHMPAAAREVIRSVLNFSYSRGVLPQGWRDANAVPLYKEAGSQSNAGSYRPISLTVILCKLVESMLLKRFEPLMKKLYAHQFAYRNGVNCVDALFCLQQRVAAAFDAGQHCSVAFLDLSKAFDSVWHEGLLVQLHEFGVTGAAWRWIRAFLKGRRVRVVFRSATSAWFDVLAGTPQGAHLSPFMFAVFVEPISRVRQRCLLQFFADDLGVAPPAGVHGRAGDALVTKTLDHVDLEVRIWKLRLGLKKCFVIVFSRMVPNPIPIFINDYRLARLTKGKYLGLVLNERWEWGDHTAFVLARVGSSLKSIALHVAATSPAWSVVMQLVQALVLPRVTYGMPVYAPTPADSSKLATALARGLYRVLNVPDNPSAMAVLVDNSLLSPEFGLRLAALRYAHRLWKSKATRNPAAGLLVGQLRSAVGGVHAFSTARLVHEAESDLRVQFDVAKLNVKRLVSAALLLQRKRAVQPRPGSSDDEKARKDMMPTAGPALFYQLLNRSDARVMALFRYNRVGLNHLAARRGGPVAADCPFCVGEKESVRHVLLDCPKYDVPRLLCRAALCGMYVPFSLEVLLGAVEPLHEDRRKRALPHIVSFLYNIRGARGV